MPPLLDDEDRSGLERAGRARQHQAGSRWRWGGSLSQRASVARRLPQAVFKISSYSHGGGAMWDRANYISREGELAVETDDGLQLLDLAEVDEMVSRWAEETPGRQGGRLAMNAVVSFPAGVDQAQATEAARHFLSAAFGDNHEYFFAAHDDTANFHIHVVVKCQGRDGTKLSIGPPELGALRELFAEKAAEQGIELDASPRWARGLDREAQPPAAVAGIERRGEVPRWSCEARAALAEARAEENPLPATADRSARERLEYARAAALVVADMAQLRDDKSRAQAVGLAADLALYAEQMPGQRAVEADSVWELTRSTERALRAEINAISDPALKRAAIESRARLSAALPSQRGRELDAAEIEQEPAPAQAATEIEPPPAVAALEREPSPAELAAIYTRFGVDRPAREREPDAPSHPEATAPARVVAEIEREPVREAPLPPAPQPTAWETVKERVGAWFSRDQAPAAEPAPPAAAAVQTGPALASPAPAQPEAEHPGPESVSVAEPGRRRLAREALAAAQAEAAAEPDGGLGSALVHAKAAGRLALRLHELGKEGEDDRTKVETLHAVAALGSEGLELARNDREPPAEREQAREIIWRTQRVLVENIRGIEGEEAKREAIEANRRLAEDLTEYRHERQRRAERERQAEHGRQRERGRDRDGGWDWER